MSFPHPLSISHATHYYEHCVRLHVLMAAPSETGARYFLALWPEGSGHGMLLPDGTLALPEGREQWLDAVEIDAVFGDDAPTVMECLLEATK